MHCSSQPTGKLIKIYSIIDCEDGFVISGVDLSNNDTLTIISSKDTVCSKSEYEQIIIGKSYVVNIESVGSKISAMPIDHFLVRVGKTVVWRGGDNPHKMPFISSNIKGDCIEKIASQ